MFQKTPQRVFVSETVSVYMCVWLSMFLLCAYCEKEKGCRESWKVYEKYWQCALATFKEINKPSSISSMECDMLLWVILKNSQLWLKYVIVKIFSYCIKNVVWWSYTLLKSYSCLSHSHFKKFLLCPGR